MSDYHPKPMTAGEEAYLKCAWRMGYSASEIGRCLRASPKRVIAIAARLGLPARPASRPRVDLILPKLKPYHRLTQAAAEAEPRIIAAPGNFDLWNSAVPGLARKGLVPWDKLRGER